MPKYCSFRYPSNLQYDTVLFTDNNSNVSRTQYSSNFYFFLPSLVDGDFCGDFFAAGG